MPYDCDWFSTSLRCMKKADCSDVYNGDCMRHACANAVMSPFQSLGDSQRSAVFVLASMTFASFIYILTKTACFFVVQLL